MLKKALVSLLLLAIAIEALACFKRIDQLAATRTDKVTELKTLRDAHQASARKPLYPFVAEMPVAVDKTLAEHFESGDEYIYWPN